MPRQRKPRRNLRNQVRFRGFDVVYEALDIIEDIEAALADIGDGIAPGGASEEDVKELADMVSELTKVVTHNHDQIAKLYDLVEKALQPKE